MTRGGTVSSIKAISRLGRRKNEKRLERTGLLYTDCCTKVLRSGLLSPCVSLPSLPAENSLSSVL